MGYDLQAYFTRADKLNVKCNLCSKNVKTSGNSSNFLSHLKNNHPEVAKKICEEKKRFADSDTEITGNENESSSEPTPRLKNARMCRSRSPLITTDTEAESDREANCDYPQRRKILPRQLSLHSMYENIASYGAGGSRDVEITNSLIQMICVDNLPLHCVEKIGMRKFLKVAVPRYQVPSRFKVTQLIDQKYTAMVKVVKNALTCADSIAFTSDIVTLTNGTRAFLTVTAHFIVENELNSMCLTAVRLSQSHTGDFIATTCEDVLAEFGISKEQRSTMTTDGAANMKAAVSQLLGPGAGRHVVCSAHLLNLLVTDALKEIKVFDNLIEDVKKIVKYFKHSVSAMDQLRQIQMDNGKLEGDVLLLIQNIDTRWNSCYEMLNRFITLRDEVGKILRERPLYLQGNNFPDMITASRIQQAIEFLELLKPFKQASEELGGEKYPTSSLTVPIALMLQKGLEAKERDMQNVFAEALRVALLAGVDKRLKPLARNVTLAKATLLDPRFKKAFLHPMTVQEAQRDIQKEIDDACRVQECTNEIPDAAAQTKTPEETSVWDHMSDVLKENTGTSGICRSDASKSQREFEVYYTYSLTPRNDNPILFWKNNQGLMPNLSKIALKYLTTPASSVASERVASTLKLCVPNARSRLTHDNAKKRVFLKTLPEKYWYL